MLAKRRAVERFERRARKFAVQLARPPAGATQAAAYETAPMAAAIRRDSTADEGRRWVRELLAETMRPHSVSGANESEPLTVIIREEFGPEVATALSPDAGNRFTPVAREAVVSTATERRRGLDRMYRTLDGEERSLRAALAVLDEYGGWVAWADETPLSKLGSDALRRHHETLTGHREACNRLVHERQRHLNGAIHYTATVEVDHRFLTTYLYEDRAADYPVLAAATHVDDNCMDCQRVVHDHFVRCI